MEIIWEQFTAELTLFFTDLNWTFIFIFVIVMLGIKDNVEFKWWKKLLSKFNLEIWASWIAGIVLILIFCLFSYLEGHISTTAEFAAYISSSLRSYVTVIAFSDIILRKLKKLGEKDPKAFED